MKFPIAVQLYSVRNEMEADFEGTLKKVKEMGYDGVEFAGLFGKTADEVKKIITDIGLIPISAHVPYAEMIENPKEVLSTYARIGCKYVAVPYMTEAYRPGAEKFREAVQGIQTLGKTARELGMTLLYHNHDFEFVKIDGKYGLDVLYESVSSDDLQTELDTCWVNVAGVNPSDYIEKYSGRAPVVHLKDFVMNGKANPAQLYKLIGIDDGENAEDSEHFAFRPVGYGVQDFKSILAASEKAGAKWVVVEQDEPSMGKTPMESIKMSLDYLKSEM